MLRPVRNYFRSLNIKYNIYINDSQVAAKSKILAEHQNNFCIHVFELLGWKVNYSKSNLIGLKIITYLGFQILAP